jgi:hypothetical protein
VDDPVGEDAAIVQRLNRALAKRINYEALRDPTSPYAGKFVGIANLEVVLVAEDWKAVHTRLEEIEPDWRRRCWIEASRDYTIPERV